MFPYQFKRAAIDGKNFANFLEIKETVAKIAGGTSQLDDVFVRLEELNFTVREISYAEPDTLRFSGSDDRGQTAVIHIPYRKPFWASVEILRELMNRHFSSLSELSESIKD